MNATTSGMLSVDEMITGTTIFCPSRDNLNQTVSKSIAQYNTGVMLT